MVDRTQSPTARERVYHALKVGVATRPELAARTGLSVPTVITAVDSLLDTGLVQLENGTQSTGGRPPAQVRLVPDRFTVTAVDLGGDVMASGRYDLAGQRLSYHEHGPLKTQPLPKAMVTADDLVRWLRSHGPADLSVIGALGVMHPRTRTFTSRAFDVTDHPLEAELTAALGWPVIVENTANLAAWNAWQRLGLTASDPLLYINYNRGFGAGMMLSGTLYHGATGAAGEISLLPTTDNLTQSDQLPVRMLTNLRTARPSATLSEVAARAQRGDERAQHVLSAYRSDLARYLTIIAAVIDPAMLVLQDVPHAADSLKEDLQLALKEVGLQTQVVISPLGPLGGLDSAAQYGITMLERDRLTALHES